MSYKEETQVLATTATDEVDLFQWDIVNATTFDGINKSIAIQDKTPDKFSDTQPKMGLAAIDGAWDTWQVTTGGSGGEVFMELPIKSGTSTYEEMIPIYAKLSPPPTDAVTQGEVTLEADKLSLSARDLQSRTVHAFSEKTFQTGKIYFEVTVDTLGTGVLIGLAPQDASPSFFFTDKQAVSYRSNGVIYTGGAPSGIKDANGQTVNGARWEAQNNTVGMAIDFDAKKVWIRGTDGTWQGDSADPVAGTGELATLDLSKDLYPLVGLYSNAKAHINLGQRTFSHAVPTGFAPGVKVSDRTQKQSDLAGAKIVARVTLTQMDAGGDTKNLMVDDAGTATTQAVEIMSFSLGDGTKAVQPTQLAFDGWLNANIGSFDNIFHAVDYAKLASQSGNIKDGMKWIAPIYSDYAVVDIPQQDPPVATDPKAVFAVLNQVAASTVDKSKLASEVSPDLIAHLGNGENAVVAISAERLTEEILFGGAAGAVAKGEDGKFKISDDKRVVSNTAEFKMHASKLLKSGEPVQPIVPAGGFEMRIEGRRLKVKYTGLKFTYKNDKLKQNEDVTFGFEQTMFLKLEETKQGNHVLFPTFNDPLDPNSKSEKKFSNFNNVVDKWKVSMRLDNPDSGLTGEWIAIICAAAGLFLGGCAFIGYRFCCRAGTAAGDLADSAASEMQANPGSAGDVEMPPLEAPGGPSQYDLMPGPPQINNYDVVTIVHESIYDAPNSPLNLNVAVDAEAEMALADDRMAFAAKPQKALPHASMLGYAKWGVGFHTLRAQGNFKDIKVMNLDAQQLKDLSEDNLDADGLGITVQKFLETALSPFEWPATKDFELSSAHLQGPLLLQGQLKPKTK